MPRKRLEWFRFRVGRAVWRVLFVPRILDESTGNELLGRCIYARRWIEISAAQTMPEICHTLLHEVMHCAGEGFACSPFDPQSEERFIETSEKRLWSILAQLGFAPPELPRGFAEMQLTALAARGM